MSKRADHGCEGFTLVEVLVALTILSTSFAVLLEVFSTSLNRVRESRAEINAVALAQSLLAEVGPVITAAPTDSRGVLGKGFTYRLHIERYGTSDDQRAWNTNAMTISASVLWDDDKRSVTLTTLRVPPKISQ